MTTSIDMVAVETGGVVSEDVVAELFDLTPVARPFIDIIGSDTADNVKKEFTDKKLNAVTQASFAISEGADLSAADDTYSGNRFYNLCETKAAIVNVTQRGRKVKTTYDTDEYLQQVMDLGRDVRLAEEASAVGNSAAIPDNPGTTVGRQAGASTWGGLNPGADIVGTAPALDGTTGGGPTSAIVPGAKRALTETLMKTQLRTMYSDGADPTHIISTPAMIEKISDYMFTSSARVATLMSDAPQSNRRGAGEGNGATGGGVTAQGAVSMYVGSFGTIILTPDRNFHTYDSDGGATGDVTDLLFVDSNYGSMCYLDDYRVEALPVAALIDKAALTVDFSFIPEATRAYSIIAELDYAADMTA